MSGSLEDALEAVALEVNDLQQQYDKFLSDNNQRQAAGVAMTPARQSEGEDLLRRLNEARQRQTPLLLLSILQSSDRLEVATRNLQQSSESQVRVSESQVKVSESQVKTTRRLLKSSMNLETFTLYLIVVALANIVVVIAQASGTKWSSTQLDVMAVAVFVALAAAGLYTRINARESKSLGKEIEASERSGAKASSPLDRHALVDDALFHR